MRNVYEIKWDLFWACKIFYWVLLAFYTGEIAREVAMGLEKCWYYFEDGEGGSVECTLSRIKMKIFSAIPPTLKIMLTC